MILKRVFFSPFYFFLIQRLNKILTVIEDSVKFPMFSRPYPLPAVDK